ncbi:MAG: class I tRNA ligase family protein, partial [Clostridiales bacterium]|nr:class I tRNA ligase family protein [Clostridiales bacterium]
SSWYFLRYEDPNCDTGIASKEAMDYWGQVDWYNGGMEHTTLHLLYSRFWNNFLYDIGAIPNAEPYKKRTAHGMILGEGNIKMSKSRGNVINPNDVVKEYGADTMRTYIMFVGDFAKAASWSSKAVAGCKRFLDRVWNLHETCSDALECSKQNVSAIHKAIKKVNEDIEAMKFNTAIATLMGLVNDFSANGCTKGDMKALILMLSPIAPHICEEMWEDLGFGSRGMACQQPWPEYDESKTLAATVQLAVQVAGKVRANIVVPVDATDDQVVETALADPKIQRQAEGKTLVKKLVIRDKKTQAVKIVNLIFK